MDVQIVQQFQSPTKPYRPRMRWWLPGAFMSNDEIKREIEWLAEAGYGGAEIIHFFGIPTKDVAPDRVDQYGFGSAEWNDRMKAALETAIPLGFQLDFTVGPLWPIATPLIKDEQDDRCTQGIHIGVTYSRGHYQGPVPKSDTIDDRRSHKLIAVTAARRISIGTQVGKQATLELETAVDLIQAGYADLAGCSIDWTPPSEEEWCIFGLWSQTNGQMNDSIAAPVIDHFSKRAADAVVAYWDSHLLGDDGLRTLYEKNAGCLFCDSIELNATMLGGMYGADPMPVVIWSPEILQEFRDRRGYDLTPYLPSLFVKGLYQLGAGGKTDGDSEYDFADRAVNRRVRNDYFQTLTDMFRENHLRTLKQWANSHQMKLRYQTYGLTTDLSQGLLEVDIPETESLGFHDATDGYRLQTGAVHLAGHEIYSFEVGAVQGYGYKQTWTGHDFGLLWQLHRGFAVGINQAVLHGMSYETESAAGHFEAMFRWPGLSLMGSMFSNEWGKRQPNSRHARDMTDYIARNQYVLRLGQQKVDLAVYRFHWDGIHRDMGIEPTVFDRAGYSYDFVSPSLLELPNAAVGRFEGSPALDADGPAYKALVLDKRKSTDNGEWIVQEVPAHTAEILVGLAENGLPVILIGETPKHGASFGGSIANAAQEDAQLEQAMLRLMKLPNVKQVSSHQEAVDALAEFRILPSVQSHHGVLLSVRRYQGGDNYYYLYNPTLNEAFEGEVLLQGVGQVYLLNAWEGKARAISNVMRLDGKIALPIQLAPNAAVLIGIGQASDEASVNLHGEAASWEGPMISLDQWQLTVESWTAGDHPTETRLETISLELKGLKSWTDIPELEKVSGIGRYVTAFSLDDTLNRSRKARLELREVSDTCRVILNGHRLTGFDQIAKCVVMDGSLLREGSNLLEIEVATTLNNALDVYDPGRIPQLCGLMGPVTIQFDERTNGLV